MPERAWHDMRFHDKAFGDGTCQERLGACHMTACVHDVRSAPRTPPISRLEEVLRHGVVREDDRGDEVGSSAQRVRSGDVVILAGGVHDDWIAVVVVNLRAAGRGDLGQLQNTLLRDDDDAAVAKGAAIEGGRQSEGSCVLARLSRQERLDLLIGRVPGLRKRLLQLFVIRAGQPVALRRREWLLEHTEDRLASLAGDTGVRVARSQRPRVRECRRSLARLLMIPASQRSPRT